MGRSSIWIPITMLWYRTFAADSDYNILNTDGSYDFRYDNPDSYHESHANRNNIVNGVFGGRNPATGGIDRTEYTAGPRGFRPKGKNVVRKYDLSQRPVGPIGNKDDPYFDPYEDPSYNFQFNTRVYNRKEGANRFGDVKGSYTFLDDVGDKHEVQYIAGKNTGFHVKTPYPDSYPNSYRTLFFKDPRKPYMRGRSFVQRGLDGSYRFAALGPDHRRTEVSDSVGNVRGSYSYKDEKGVLHAVHYIAGPNIGYRVLKNVKGPHLPTIFPFNSQDIIPGDFYDAKDADSDVFAQAASTYVTPKPNKDQDKYDGDSDDSFNQIDKGGSRPGGSPSSGVRPTKPSQNLFGGGGSGTSAGSNFGISASGSGGDDEEEELFDDLFNSGTKPAPNRPTTIRPSTYKPPRRPIRPIRPTQASITTIKPQNLNSEDDSDAESNIFSSRPSGSFGGAKPSSDEDLFDIGASGSAAGGDDIFGPTSSTNLFGGGSVSRPKPPRPTRPTKPLLQFDLTGLQNGDSHTIITNYGDTVFTAPPGVPVRAHVQSIGLLPLLPRSPSPSAQYRADIDDSSEEDVEPAANSHIKVDSTINPVITTILATPSASAISTLASTDMTTSVGTTTTQLPESTTTS
ncbi:cuticle protein [Holotrichia oblita]|uniref:Cuticle protein n=1 Tax=Holotrichia oblita TaxID=644536 RepID=A0ACB9TBY3_HOLOL|nr:cuticle protein [Holotrichia oblita]